MIHYAGITLSNSVYDNITAVLKEKKMSLRALAEAANIKYTTLHSAMKRRPEHFPVKYAEAIAKVFDMPIDPLYGKSYRPWVLPDEEKDLNDFVSGSLHEVNESNLDKLLYADGRESLLLDSFSKLNLIGQLTLLERANELTKITEYTQSDTEENIDWSFVIKKAGLSK